jgi:hypothetical protein
VADDHDLKMKGVAFHLEISLVTTPARCQYDEQICQKLGVVMAGTSLVVVVAVESETNENGK